MNTKHYLLVLGGLVLATGGCASTSDPVPLQRAHGLISFPELSSLPILSVGPPLRAGVPTMVVVRTFGSSTCDLPAGVDVAYAGAEVTLTPWVRVAGQGDVCTDDLAAHRHEAIVTFAQAGTNRVTVYGYKRDVTGHLVLGTVSVDVTVDP